LPEKPVNIGFTAQKARKQGDGPPALGGPTFRQGPPTRALKPGGSQKCLSAEGSDKP